MNTFLKIVFLFVILGLCLPSNASAILPRGTTMTGVIRSVNPTTRQIVFTQDHGPVREFVWSEWAKFWRNDPDTSPTALKAGMRVQVNLHSPLFGPDYVTKIVLLNSAQKAGPEGRK